MSTSNVHKNAKKWMSTLKTVLVDYWQMLHYFKKRNTLSVHRIAGTVMSSTGNGRPMWGEGGWLGECLTAPPTVVSRAAGGGASPGGAAPGPGLPPRVHPGRAGPQVWAGPHREAPGDLPHRVPEPAGRRQERRWGREGGREGMVECCTDCWDMDQGWSLFIMCTITSALSDFSILTLIILMAKRRWLQVASS